MVPKKVLSAVAIITTVMLAVSLVLTGFVFLNAYDVDVYMPWSDLPIKPLDPNILSALLSLITVLILAATYIHSNNAAIEQREEVSVSIQKQEQHAALNSLVSIIKGHADLVRGFSLTLEQGKRIGESGNMPEPFRKPYSGSDVFLAMWREWIHEFNKCYSELAEYRKGKLPHYFVSLITLLKYFRKQLEAGLIDAELGSGLILSSISLHENRIIALYAKHDPNKETLIKLLEATHLTDLMRSCDVDKECEKQHIPQDKDRTENHQELPNNTQRPD